MNHRIIATWPFGAASCAAGLKVLADGGSALDAVEAGAKTAEDDPTVDSVGFGGLPNADGVVELDAVIMDGRTHSAGAVAGLTRTRNPISVARRVMEATSHSLLVGQNARRFALSQGFADAALDTPASQEKWRQWTMTKSAPTVAHFPSGVEIGHDTVGVLALDDTGNLAGACSTSGLAWKLPGRVGDSPIIGSGLYVDNEVGAAAATGNGDEMMKVCLSYRVVHSMSLGMSPQEACAEAILYLLRKRPGHQGQGASIIALDRMGNYGQASTTEGFSPPERAWIYAYSRDGEVVSDEGDYVE
jgi:isoaspartyl peptidase/L-asparaginase-like protein (Ntn-hydrolase superfamily)